MASSHTASSLPSFCRFTALLPAPEEPEPMSDDAFASDPNLFSGEEIDNMEMADLDRLSLEELNVYLNKVNRTMKELRNQERKWKERNIRLMDMREEIENLLEER